MTDIALLSSIIRPQLPTLAGRECLIVPLRVSVDDLSSTIATYRRPPCICRCNKLDYSANSERIVSEYREEFLLKLSI